MNWGFVFGLTNAVALVGWVMLALLPRGPRLMATVMYGGVALLCLVYALMLGLLMTKVIDPVIVSAPAEAASFRSIGGIRALFASDGGIVLGWTHYLAFDLFVGLWIARDADHKGFSRIFQLPFLVATLLAGPVGLIAWLIVRERRARQVARGT